jgi:hypothetical protein
MYYLIVVSYCLQVSVALSSSFGKHTDGGRWLINHIMDKVLANLAGWSSEENLINDTLNLFIALVDKRDRYVLLYSAV